MASSFDLRLYITGTAQPKLTQNNLNKIPIPRPPLNEQKRIVEKLEQLLSELDKAVDALESAQTKLKTYRRAVSKAAVEELSRAWREENKERLEYETPKKWKAFLLSDVVELIDGDKGPNYPKRQDYLESGYCLFITYPDC